LAAVCHLRLVVNGWSEEPEAGGLKATSLARQALDVGGNDADILVSSAFVLAQFGEDHGAMIGLVDRALALNPSFAFGWQMSGNLRIFAGQLDLAIEHVEAALRLSPRQRTGSPLTALGAAYFYKRRFGEAASKLVLAIQDSPGLTTSYRILAACYAHMGRLDDARATVAKLRAITPEVVPNSVAAPRNLEYRELLLSGLRLAMGEGT
jgi:tetratricopeptide (TPR) repeat protein